VTLRLTLAAACDLARALDVSLDYLGGFANTDSLSPLETLFKQKIGLLPEEKIKALEGLLLVL